MSNIAKSRVSTLNTTSNDVVTDSCSTNRLSSLFASFLASDGGSNSSVFTEMSRQKYFLLYKGESSYLRKQYDDEEAFRYTPITTIPVRSSSTSKTISGEYIATFIGTFTNERLENLDSSDQKISIALATDNNQTSSHILAFADFDTSVYNKIKEGSRADIRWDLELVHDYTSRE